MDKDSADAIGAVLDGLGDGAAVVDAMAQLKRAIEPEGTLTLREFEPGDLGWMVQRHGALYAREYGWDQSFERLVARIAADFDPTTDRALGRGDRRRTRWARSCASTMDETTAKLRTLLVEPNARGMGLGNAPRATRSSGTPERSGYTTLDAVDQRHPARRAPDLREPRLRSCSTRRRTPRVRQARPRLADLVAYPQAMDRDDAEGAAGAAEEPLQGRPDRGARSR